MCDASVAAYHAPGTPHECGEGTDIGAPREVGTRSETRVSYQPPREQLFGSATGDENPPCRVALMTSDLGETLDRPAPRGRAGIGVVTLDLEPEYEGRRTLVTMTEHPRSGAVHRWWSPALDALTYARNAYSLRRLARLSEHPAASTRLSGAES